MSQERITLGKLGENIAKQRLTSIGYKILKTNYRCSLGEIDIIAREGDTLAFVEIKTRRNNPLGQVKEAVDRRKQRQISKVALSYIKANNLMGKRARFDVVAIRLVDNKEEVEVVKNAFELAY